MPRILNASQLAHVTYYDTLFRNIGVTNVINGSTLFASAGTGRRDLTNMKTPGALPGDQVLLVKSLRIPMYFQGLNDSEYNQPYGNFPAIIANAVASNSRAQDCYGMSIFGSYFTFEVGNKPYLLAPTLFAPAGGGPYGSSTENSRHVISNGVPQTSATLRFAKPVQISARQPFTVKVDWYAFLRMGNGVGATGLPLGNDLDPLGFVNNFDGLKVWQCHAEGIETRDVE